MKKSQNQLGSLLLALLLYATGVASAMIFRDANSRQLYLQRLGLPPTFLAARACTQEWLGTLTEAHLKTIPFENLAQHGAAGGLQTLDLEATFDKIVRRNRGGFCLEVNALLGAFLEQACDLNVSYVPSTVYKYHPDTNPTGFGHDPTHFVLIVRDPLDNNNNQDYLVDVGFGEPSIHPLEYPALNQEQETAEGMRSRLVRIVVDGEPHIQQEWWRNDGWMPRLLWKQDYDPTTSLDDLQILLERVLEPSSTFSRKIIVCRITREDKRTLAGNVWKCTSPRGFQSSAKIQRETNRSREQVRQILLDQFGIPLDETRNLDLSKSLQEDPSVWDHM